MADPNEPLALFTRVEIGGRTMLRPGFSLVGLTGMVYLRAPGAPADCSTVLIDWAGHGLTPQNGYPEGSLPPLVNVPTAHLSPLTDDAAPKVQAHPGAGASSVKPSEGASTPARSSLSLVPSPGDEAQSHSQDEAEDEAETSAEIEASTEPDSGDESEPERPKLRLI